MIPIVFSTDHNYVMPTGVTICSLLLSDTQEAYDIYVLVSPDVTADDKKQLTMQVETLSKKNRISFVEMGNRFQDGFEIREISTACYYRLMIPWLIPHIDKIIYADVDVIFKTSLRDLFDLNLGENYVAGSFPNSQEGWYRMEKYFNKIGADYRTYINSGILVINSKLQRQDSLDVKYNQLATGKYLYQDQDIINIVCKGRISHFERRYNLMPNYYGVESDLEGVILHYAGDKPWKTFTYAWAEWWDVYKSSIFWNARFYKEISARILNPKEQLKMFRRKSMQKIKQLTSNFKS